MQPRIIVGFIAYSALAIAAVLTLNGKFRIAVLILLAGLAVKTYLSTLQNK